MALNKNATRYSAGENVMLRSGGPKMTVGHVDGDVVWCLWFDGAVRQDAQFPIDTIRPAGFDDED